MPVHGLDGPLKLEAYWAGLGQDSRPASMAKHEK